VQRLFTMFPPGLPGLALLLLRASVAIALLMDTCCRTQDISGWIQGAAILLSVSLFAGYLTPIVVLLGLVIHIVSWFVLGVGNATITIVIILDALALALLGPGAYSVDSYRFGRRIVALPPS
jgi:integral membrane sensor domain MASE1